MTTGSLREIRIGIGWTVAVAIVSACAAGGAAWATLSYRVGALERDLGLRDAFQSEIRSLRDSVESQAHADSRTNDRLHDIDIVSIQLALAKAGIHVEN